MHQPHRTLNPEQWRGVCGRFQKADAVGNTDVLWHLALVLWFMQLFPLFLLAFFMAQAKLIERHSVTVTAPKTGAATQTARVSSDHDDENPHS